MNCFCGGKYQNTLEKWMLKGYLECDTCGSFGSVHAVLPYELYSKDYWNGKDRSTLPDQWSNLVNSFNGEKPRVQYWWDMIKHLSAGKSFEIGCAPGALIMHMFQHGWDAHGCEPDQEVIDFMVNKGISRDELFIGLWPYFKISGLNKFDLIISTDVLEHSDDPEKFMSMINILLKENGHALIQTPVIMHGMSEDKPFGDISDRLFVSDEHVNLFSLKGFQHLCEVTGFAIEDVKIWHPGHECFLLRKIC